MGRGLSFPGKTPRREELSPLLSPQCINSYANRQRKRPLKAMTNAPAIREAAVRRRRRRSLGVNALKSWYPAIISDARQSKEIMVSTRAVALLRADHRPDMVRNPNGATHSGTHGRNALVCPFVWDIVFRCRVFLPATNAPLLSKAEAVVIANS